VLGNGLLADVLAQAEPDADQTALRELANDLCLKTTDVSRRKTWTRSYSGR